MNLDTTAELVFEALGHAIAGNADEAAQHLMTIGQNSDNNRMYGVCWAIASAGEHMLCQIYGARAPKTERGEMWALQQLQPGALDDDPPKAFAARFLVAHCNKDTGTALALFQSALTAGDDDYVASIAALLATVAGISRLAIDQKKGGRS